MKKIALFTCIAIAAAACKNQTATAPLPSGDSVSTETALPAGEAINEGLQEPDSALVTQNYLVDNKSVKKDFSFISENCGIFIPIDTIQAARLKKEYGEEDFYTIADDNAFYDYQAAEFLKKMDVKTIYPSVRYLKFKVNGDTVCLDTKSRFNTQGITILYKTNALPKVYGSVEIEQEYSSYFK